MTWIFIIFLLAVAGGATYLIIQRRKKKVEALTPLPASNLRQVQTFQVWDNQLPGSEEVNVAKNGLLIHLPEYFGVLRRGRVEYTCPTLIHEFEPATIEVARIKVNRLRALNPNLKLLVEVAYCEGRDHYTDIPTDHPWWLRINGQRVPGWGDSFKFNLNLEDLRQNCAQTCRDLWDLGLFDGFFLDVFEDEPNRVDMLRRIRALCPTAVIEVNCNYRICPNVAPLVNGFYMECGDRAPWTEVIATLDYNERHVIQPAMNLLEISGSRDDVRKMTAATCLMLARGNGYVLYSDPISHQHARFDLWDLDLGKPLAPPETDKVFSFRRFERANVNFILPPDNSFIQMI